MIWTAPNGRQWIYDISIPGWKALAATGNSNIIYRGGLDLTQDPFTQYASIESGNQFAVTVGAAPVDGTMYPGLSGNIAAGSVLMYDGNEWQLMASVPTASTSTPGVVQLATCDEAYDGISDSKALTASTGKCLFKQAEINEVGITRYSSRAEAEAGTVANAALTPYSIANLLDRINETVGKLVPTGMIMWWTSPSSIPTGWIKCDGRAISSTGTTADLYQFLLNNSTAWNNGTTVRVPDLRGRFIRGYNDGSMHDPADPPFGDYQEDTFQTHGHSVSDPGHDHRISGNGYNASATSPGDDVIVDDNLGVAKTSSTNDSLTGITVEPAGGGPETRPKNINLTAVIKL